MRTLLGSLIALSLAGCGVVEHVVERSGEKIERSAERSGKRSNWTIGTVKGSGVPKTEQRTVEPFSKIEAGGAAELTVTQGAQSVSVTTDDNLLGILETKVTDGVLKIRFTKGVTTNSRTKIVVSVPKLSGLDLSGACTAKVGAIDPARFFVDLSGATAVAVSGTTGDLSADVSGSSELVLVGSARSATVEASGASHVKGLRTTGSAKLDASGASTVEAKCDGEVDADSSGASHIRITGSPKFTGRSESGAGSISVGG